MKKARGRVTFSSAIAVVFLTGGGLKRRVGEKWVDGCLLFQSLAPGEGSDAGVWAV